MLTYLKIPFFADKSTWQTIVGMNLQFLIVKLMIKKEIFMEIGIRCVLCLHNLKIPPIVQTNVQGKHLFNVL